MEVSSERVTGSAAAGDRDSHPRWAVDAIEDDSFEDYEPLFKAFIKKFAQGGGSFKIGGNLTFEFPQKIFTGSKLISPETSFFFHEFEEKSSNVTDIRKDDDVIRSYQYQKKVPPLDFNLMEEFMPVI